MTEIPIAVHAGATDDDLAAGVIDLVRKIRGEKATVLVAYFVPSEGDPGKGAWRVKWAGDNGVLLRLARTANELLMDKMIPMFKEKEIEP
jgi:hypothetical protein